jgi:phosphoglycerate kinase
MFLNNNISLEGKDVVLRTDFNVPITNNEIQSTKRIDESLYTINFILERNPNRLIIISHLGRPTKVESNLTLKPICEYLGEILNTTVVLKDLYSVNSSDKGIILLENIRFYREETEITNKTVLFRKKLSTLGNVFINDAFGCCHREHSSIVGIDIKNKYAGFLVEKELNYLDKIFSKKGIKTLILGGSKISDKIHLIKNIIPKVNNILIGGGMAFTFLKYNNFNIGNSLLDLEGIKLIPDIINFSKLHQTNIYLPIDYLCNNVFSNIGDIKYFRGDIQDNYIGLDIGDETINLYKSLLRKSDIIIWNGPLGVFEFDNFKNGSKDIMEFITTLNVISVIGGGDTATCCEKFSLDDKFTHVSTGGGASLELLQGINLPGISYIKI